MTNLRQLQVATRDRIRPAVLDWNSMWFERRTIPAPAYAVFARDPWADLNRAQGNSSAARWHLQIGLYLAAPTPQAEESAHSKMSDLADTQGPIMSRLRDRLIRDDLYGLVRHSIKFGQGRGFKIVHRNGDRILAAYIEFDCLTDS